ncbi:GL10188 [Drosophila persimilis]|uniref:E3 ubiquitin-protein ligase RMND5A n=2 Tax=pseudoobscura subgroup TaxID=32358 RepID=A0A6I8UWA3_DROPS|nr:E3 ubiquitin-protein ligase RMND5A [Drosophila pseudoobscura]XP_002025918.1 E3 ubiquitin-protein ligase RMND5A [Drosophila persimilis]EDW32825.1 GL10188 [Drosophila persimilis]
MDSESWACSSVEKDLDRVVTKLEQLRDNASADVGDIAMLMSDLVNALGNAEQMVTTLNSSTQVNANAPSVDDPMGDGVSMQVETEPTAPQRPTDRHMEVIRGAILKCNERVQKLSTEHRDLHGSISKIGKAIDRNFSADFTSTMRVDVLQDEENLMLLNKAIAKHYCRQGMDTVARTLIKECKMTEDQAQDVFDSEREFADIYSIWMKIQKRELTEALKWTKRYSPQLMERHSLIEFRLHRMRFMQLVSYGVESQNEAVVYARTNFKKFALRYEHEIANLMASFIYLPAGLENSPYKHFLGQEMWTELSFIFLKDACQLLGISKNSALSVVVNAGCTALPALLNIKQVMQSRQVLGMWNGCDELPIEIDLQPEFRFHSIFACPILRQQTSEDNPPKKLTCGHVISNDALHKLSNGHILKCPYCPVEQNAEEAVRIYF